MSILDQKLNLKMKRERGEKETQFWKSKLDLNNLWKISRNPDQIASTSPNTLTDFVKNTSDVCKFCQILKYEKRGALLF